MKEKIETLTINFEEFFDSGHMCYTIDINGKEYMCMPMGVKDVLEFVSQALLEGEVEMYD